MLPILLISCNSCYIHVFNLFLWKFESKRSIDCQIIADEIIQDNKKLKVWNKITSKISYKELAQTCQEA